MTDAESETATNRDGGIPGWPTELRADWHQRTAYGELVFLAYMPFYILVWALILGTVAVFAAVLGGAYLALRGHGTVKEWWPSIYRGGHDG